ncbi:hypothetical protein AbraIFM66950_008891 [Aspergillus brasiliensis]|nr:hypothetical protein AbraIFM66950_008891 [Aspergillus brasiliensis]
MAITTNGSSAPHLSESNLQKGKDDNVCSRIRMSHQLMASSKAGDRPDANVIHTPDTNGPLCDLTNGRHPEHVGSVLQDRCAIIDDHDVDDEATIDGIGVFGSLGHGEHRGPGFFGPSSTINFLRHARRAITQNQDSGNPARSSDVLSRFFQDEGISVGGCSPSSPKTAKKTSLNLSGHRLSIPPRSQADELLDSFWKYVHSLYPVLHRPSFTKKYLTLWAPSPGRLPPQTSGSQQPNDFYSTLDDRTFHCLLNIVFAFGSQFGNTVEDENQSQVGLTFFERAKRLLDFDMLAQGSIFLVQLLVLMGHYLQGTDMTSGCWNIIGLAVRIAQGIGLHHEPDHCDQGCCSRGRLTQLEIEMRRRAWNACILFERVVSMTYGRPLMIHPSLSQKSLPPSAIDDDLLSQDSTTIAVQPPGTLSWTECYVQSVKLQNILGEVLCALYYESDDKLSRNADKAVNYLATSTSTANERLNNRELQLLLNIDKSLCSWHDNLPGHLKAQTYHFTSLGDADLFGEMTSMFNRQAIILHARYLNVRIIMFRPVLSALLHLSPRHHCSTQEHSMESAIRQDMLNKGVNLCVSSACELVDLMAANLDTANDILPPSWDSVYFGINAWFFSATINCEADLLSGASKYWRPSKPAFSLLTPGHKAAGPSWTPNIPLLPDEDVQQPFENSSVFTDQVSADWMSDFSEINWLSVQPFIQDLGDPS